MAHGGEKLRLVLARQLHLAALLLDLLEKTGIVDGGHRLIGEGLQQFNRLGREAPAALPAHDENAQRLVAVNEGHGEERANAALVQYLREAIAVGVVEVHDLDASALARAFAD